MQTGLTFLVTAYPGCPGKEAIKRVYDYCKPALKFGTSIYSWAFGDYFLMLSFI